VAITHEALGRTALRLVEPSGYALL